MICCVFVSLFVACLYKDLNCTMHIISSTLIHFIDLQFNSVLLKASNEYIQLHQDNWSYLLQHLVTHSSILDEITPKYFCQHLNNNSRKDFFFFWKNSTKCISHVSVCSKRFVALYYYMYIVFKWMFHMQCNNGQCCQL